MFNKFSIQETSIFFLKGNDRIDFLNRISTNEFRSFKNNKFVKTLLLSEKGRIVDLITVFEFGTYSLIKSSFQNKSAVSDYINKYIFTDDVSIEEATSKYKLITLAGEDIIGFVNREYNVPRSEDNRYFIIENNSILYFDTYEFPIVRILAETNNSNDLLQGLEEFHNMSDDDYDYFCIMNNIPESINELNVEINPLECGLNKYISFEKGCFIGQEVIARLDSQQKLPKQMVRFESFFELAKNDKIYYREANYDLYECGYINKVVKKNLKYVGFGFIRNIYLKFERKYFDKHNNPIQIGSIKEQSKIQLS